ncbi:cAMP-specific 3',5'-cyclic phosphodiesterase 4D [Anabarilius grahami]|uniref:cAMP-specific 3',5'-cyclic phosphodiesterase 4D n=1 Tax=Anabarilius grahami TaxID=495550 RepID=A0A3N0YPZ0_ANAGA|nr:cAMP-specific 3',5'-cyclic phosphodiesterase 4D [Anabarilius grahami]
MELIQVRRRSSRNLQLPPLAFRQAEQHDWNSKEMEPIARPTTLALRIPPLIAITSADSGSDRQHQCGEDARAPPEHLRRQQPPASPSLAQKVSVHISEWRDSEREGETAGYSHTHRHKAYLKEPGGKWTEPTRWIRVTDRV